MVSAMVMMILAGSIRPVFCGGFVYEHLHVIHGSLV